MEPPKKRRPRFSRVPFEPHILSADDQRILAYVERYRFLRTTHIAKLVGRSIKGVHRNLRILFHAGFLDRPKCQIDYYSRNGSQPLAYALSDKGAAVLERIADRVPEAKHYREANRTVTRPYLEHTLLIADILVPFATLDKKDVAYIEENDIAPSPAWKLTAGDFSVRPDALFGLHFKDLDRRAYFFVEADRATMPIVRTNLAQTSFKRKLATYLAAHKAKEHTAKLGIHNFRVLTVTTSKERTASMLAAVNELTEGKGSGIFLFTDRAAFLASDPMTTEWHTTAGAVQLDVPPRNQPPTEYLG